MTMLFIDKAMRPSSAGKVVYFWSRPQGSFVPEVLNSPPLYCVPQIAYARREQMEHLELPWEPEIIVISALDTTQARGILFPACDLRPVIYGLQRGPRPGVCRQIRKSVSPTDRHPPPCRGYRTRAIQSGGSDAP